MLQTAGYDVVSTELVKHGFGQSNRDFLAERAPPLLLGELTHSGHAEHLHPYLSGHWVGNAGWRSQ